MNITFDPNDEQDRRRVIEIVQRWEGGGERPPTLPPSRSLPASDRQLRRLAKSKTGVTFLAPFAERVQTPMTAEEIGTMLGVGTEGIKSYLRIITKFTKNHPIALGEIITTHSDQVPNKYVPADGLKERLDRIG